MMTTAMVKILMIQKIMIFMNKQNVYVYIHDIEYVMFKTQCLINKI